MNIITSGTNRNYRKIFSTAEPVIEIEPEYC